MFFSEYYGIDSSVVEHYGAVDISFVCDIPLFIDPILEYEDNQKRNKRSVNERSVKNEVSECLLKMRQFSAKRRNT